MRKEKESTLNGKRPISKLLAINEDGCLRSVDVNNSAAPERAGIDETQCYRAKLTLCRDMILGRAG